MTPERLKTIVEYAVSDREWPGETSVEDVSNDEDEHGDVEFVCVHQGHEYGASFAAVSYEDVPNDARKQAVDVLLDRVQEAIQDEEIPA